jgi:hypothetical protein
MVMSSELGTQEVQIRGSPMDFANDRFIRNAVTGFISFRMQKGDDILGPSCQMRCM